MKIANYIFYFILFLGFFLPSNGDFYISFSVGLLSVREFAFLLLPVVNLFCWSNRGVCIADRKSKILIALFLIVILVTELFKHLYYDEGIVNAIKTTRMGLPLFSSLLLVYSGIRADIEKVWQILLYAISVSAVLTLITPFVFLPIYPSFEGQNILEALYGRLMNSNNTFGFIGIYLLFRDKGRWYNKGWLPIITALLSIASLIMSFNRTYLALMVLAYIHLVFTEFSVRKIIKILSLPIIVIGMFSAAYNNSEAIKNQVDQRIFDIVLGSTLLSESVYENNRDVIFDGVSNRIFQGYWLFGLSYDTPFHIVYNASKNEYFGLPSIDTSVLNILLRYGIVPLILFIMIFYRLCSRSKPGVFIFSLSIYTLASLNTDAFFKDNSIFFLLAIYVIQNYYPKSKTFQPNLSN